jgi:D-sedoheptulose 7-phosphate isomerase
MAIDYAKNGGLRATAFNDAALLTCLANDYGYDRVFARSIELLGRPGDLLIAISSSGRSPDILQAVEAARQGSCAVVTLSGFAADNPLRQLGDLNFYVPSAAYGPVEITHLAICHAILDLAAGLAAGGTET